MSDSHSNSFHLTYNSLNDAVDEAMKYLEPSSHQLLTVESVARAYTILQQAQAAVECHYGEQIISARFHQIKSILNNKNESQKCTALARWVYLSKTKVYALKVAVQ